MTLGFRQRMYVGGLYCELKEMYVCLVLGLVK